MNLPRQNTPSSPSPTSTSHKATMSSPLPKNYKKVVQSLIHRSDISVEVKIDLWKRFAEYQACVDEEEHLADEEEPVFVATSTKATVGKVGPDFVMPTPWMEKESSDSGEGEYNGDDGDSGYEGNGSSSVDGGENTRGEEHLDDGEHTGGVDMKDTTEESVEEIIISSDSDSDQSTNSNDTSNEIENGNGSTGATLLTSGQENVTTATTTTSCNTNQETQTADNTTIATNIVPDTTQPPNSVTELPTHPTTHATPPTPTPAPSNNFTRVRHDIRTYFSHLAARERLLCTREKWVTSRAEALWQNAEVLTGILRREFNGMGRKRVLREFEKGERAGRGWLRGVGRRGGGRGVGGGDEG